MEKDRRGTDWGEPLELSKAGLRRSWPNHGRETRMSRKATENAVRGRGRAGLAIRRRSTATRAAFSFPLSSLASAIRCWMECGG